MLLKKTVTFSILLIIGMLFVKSIRFNRFVQTTASIFFYPFLVIQHKTIDPIKRYVAHQKETKALYSSYEQLQKAYNDLMQHYIRAQALVDMYADIQELIPFKGQYGYEHSMLAQVLQRYVGQDEQYFLLDKGSHHNIEKDMVVVYKNMLLGKILDIFPYYSKCMLITDKRCKVAAYCTQSDACGVVKGTNTIDELHLLYVSHLKEVQQSDLVLSSGQGLIFPRGFGIGTIVDSEKEQVTYHILCKPLIDLATITYCYIIKKSDT